MRVKHSKNRRIFATPSDNNIVDDHKKHGPLTTLCGHGVDDFDLANQMQLIKPHTQLTSFGMPHQNG